MSPEWTVKTAQLCLYLFSVSSPSLVPWVDGTSLIPLLSDRVNRRFSCSRWSRPHKVGELAWCDPGQGHVDGGKLAEARLEKFLGARST
jgi:hypothetical protein